MGQVLHRSATTTEAIRRAIQHSQESMRALARRHGINQKTVAKWKKRESTADHRPGPAVPRSTVLSVEQEAIIVAFRKHTLLPLDDCLYALQATIPELTRSSLHRCLERHGISRLPEVEGDNPRRKKFDTYPIGFFHIGLAEVSTAEGKLYFFVAIDRTSKFAVVKLVDKADMRAAAVFLEALVEAVPYRIHTVLTDNGIQFADLPKNRQGPTARFRGHPFDRLCLVHGIEHRLTRPNHPWTNGQVERMNRTIKDATVKRYFYDTHNQLKAHLNDFLQAYNFARRLKTLKGLTPYEYLCKLWTQTPDRFTLNPIHQMPGLNRSRMDALYNERGVVYAWLHANGNIYSLEGRALVWVDDDGVYNWEGVHIAWWANGHIRDWLGAVCLFTKNATKTLVVKPVGELHQQRPLNLETPQRPLKWPKMAKPPNLCIWTTKMPF